MIERKLCEAAISAMKAAYAPYSGFMVGAALLTTEGKIYSGCNIENSSYSVTVCAERTALFKAVSEGKRNFQMLALVGGKNGVIQNGITPCGVCRQALAEFCGPDFPILLITGTDAFTRSTLGELLPQSFSGDCL